MYNIEDIKKVLPHRYPFLLIDQVDEVVEGKSAKGKKNITISDPVFMGHFPAEPVYPGVLIVEAIAQVGAFAILSEPDNKGKKAYFARIKNARFFDKVVPGDTLIINTELTTKKLNIGFAKGQAYVGEKLVCEVEIGFAID